MKRAISNVEKAKAKAEILHLYEINEAKKEYDRNYEAEKKETVRRIEKFMSINGVNSFKLSTLGSTNFRDDIRNLKCSKVISRRVNYDAEKIEKRLDKDLAGKFIEKEYIVNNMNGLISLLKKSGVSASEFKKFIDVKRKVNKSKLDKLSEVGEINVEDIKGCYSVEEISSYIKITEVKGDTSEDEVL